MYKDTYVSLYKTNVSFAINFVYFLVSLYNFFEDI